jgi:solute carrier family 25 oxoglutarate transporter 11
MVSTVLNFATSGLGGIMGWIIIHPFNTLAVRMNLANSQKNSFPSQNLASGSVKPTNQLSFIQFSMQQVKSNGFGSLYSGLSAGVTR